MKKRKFYIVPALLIIASFLLLIGAACNKEKQPDETAKPSASSSATGQTTPEPTPTPEVTPGEDNTVTFPSEWGDWEPPATTTEATQAPVTESGTATQTPARSPTAEPDNSGTPTPATTPAVTSTATQEKDNLATLTPDETVNTTATATASPKPTGTPIGVDEDGWVDKWY